MGAVVVVEDLHHSHGHGPAALPVLRGLSLTVRRGEIVAVTGAPGAGRTTLLGLVGGLGTPVSGRITVDGVRLDGLGEQERLRLRRDRIGIVFPSPGLLPVLTVAENIGVPLRLRNTPARERDERVSRLLAEAGLAELAGRRPDEIDGAQRRRVAVARALAVRPALLVADEPTALLGPGEAAGVLELLYTAVRARGATALVATRDPWPLSRCDRVLELRDGRLREAGPEFRPLPARS
ncbi:ATP-binding cassette domain-containing protein [Streptomyces verrucosisporus]|uniref:ABC transporter ATP-binding protein n=1 Tax=Streptomyces verrucosisporus TaxID=1695161 RepID=UPI0019D2384C|nr:ATP-binding cassette domain-containing protein [Streptomyces verrucosisporus]MBN3931911.1 ATP-binding cassette domain-containing protein [Streptomyces verrucosisporus]